LHLLDAIVDSNLTPLPLLWQRRKLFLRQRLGIEWCSKKRVGIKHQVKLDAPAQRLWLPVRKPNYFSISGKSIENHTR
jgi:hypothetical protein